MAFGVATTVLAGGQEAAVGKVVVSGVVPDESTRAAVLARLRALYGSDRVIDQVGIDKLAAPPNWLSHVQSLIDPDLKLVTGGQLRIVGNVITISGSVDSDTARAQLLQRMAAQIDNPTYTLHDGLRVTSGTRTGIDPQQLLDAQLAQRSVEFEPGKAALTATGAALLDSLVPVMQKLSGRHFEIVGHTDDVGSRESNVQLSSARADSVKRYLVGKGIPEADIATSGVGPDGAVTTNTTEAGRARNRRIDIRLLA